MWTTIGDRSFCSVHNSSTDRGIPCAQCVADPTSAVSDRDLVHLSTPQRGTAFYEERIFLVGDRCEKIGEDLAEGRRSTSTERGEPLALAAKFLEAAARCYGRSADFAAKREREAELERMTRQIREMRGAH